MHRLDGTRDGLSAIELRVDGRPLPAYPGETVAAALLAAGRRGFRRTTRGDLRGPFCNMGVCFECAVTIDGVPNVRSCMTTVAAGMTVETGTDDGTG